ncbi:hypothetical protein Cadr_000005885 [Camelus dromedarius]|uniref:Uncharacterized protein n=1 Tax=Camelus dromedarius TaxID=9838 RepID=A0A5N4E0R9_CAMDR|nr:hypothetical protein Cadr_000005885 [Camelus dromedarius]
MTFTSLRCLVMRAGVREINDPISRSFLPLISCWAPHLLSPPKASSCSCPWGIQPGGQLLSDLRKKPQPLCNLISEATARHFGHILIVRAEALGGMVGTDREGKGGGKPRSVSETRRRDNQDCATGLLEANAAFSLQCLFHPCH